MKMEKFNPTTELYLFDYDKLISQIGSKACKKGFELYTATPRKTFSHLLRNVDLSYNIPLMKNKEGIGQSVAEAAEHMCGVGAEKVGNIYIKRSYSNMGTEEEATNEKIIFKTKNLELAIRLGISPVDGMFPGFEIHISRRIAGDKLTDPKRHDLVEYDGRQEVANLKSCVPTEWFLRDVGEGR